MPFRSKALLRCLTAVFAAHFAPACANAAQPDPVRARRPARAQGHAGDRADHGRDPRPGRQFRQSAFAVSDLHHGRTASGMATGHFLGDTGVFSNTIYTGFPVQTAAGSVTPFIENDPCSATSTRISPATSSTRTRILLAARHQGFSTAAIGKLGPTLMFDHTERSGEKTIIVDDSTGTPAGIPLSQAMKDALTAAGLPLAAPSRGDNGKAGDFKTPGTLVANVDAASLFRRRRRQGRAADVQGAQQAVRAGVLVARSRRHPAQSGRQPAQRRRPASTGRPRWPRSRTPTTISPTLAPGARRARPRRHHRHRHRRRSRLLDDLQGEQDQPGRQGEIRRRAGRACCRPALSPSISPRRSAMPLFDPDNKNGAVADGSLSQARQRADRRRSGQARRRGRLERRLRPGLSAGQGSARSPRKVVEALLAQDYVSGLFVDDELGSYPRHAADVGDQPARARRARRGRRSSSTSAPTRPAATSRCCARSKSPTPACSRARACTAASAAPTP